MGSRMCKGFSKKGEKPFMHGGVWWRWLRHFGTSRTGARRASVVNRFVHIFLRLPYQAGIANNNAL